MQENSLSSTKTSVLTIDSVINEIGKKPNPLLLLVWVWATMVSMVGCLSSYIGVFAGFIPSEGLQCLSNTCKGLLKNQTGNFEHYTDIICENDLKVGVDYKWNMSRSTFSVDLNLVCSPTSLNLYHSIYYIGSMLAVLLGMLLYERLGRRRAAAIGAVTVTIATVSGTLTNSYTLLLLLRVFQGLGDILGYMGAYIWLFEMTPIQYRPFYNSWNANIWVLGYPILVCISYYIHNWRFIYLAVGMVQGLCQIPLLIYPNSPRYLLSVGRVAEARAVLKQGARLAGVELDLEGVKLINSVDAEDEPKEKKRVVQQLVEFKSYPAMLLETISLCWAWLVTGLLFYGLAYGWDRFGDSRYVTYLFVALGEMISNVGVVVVLKVIGRKTALLSFFAGASLCFFLATIDKSLSSHWNVERVMSMFAFTFAAASFALLYLLTGEVSPTSHRGMVSAGTSLFARVSAFFGPLLSSLNLTGSQRLSLFGGLAATAVVSSLVLPETRGRPIPECGRDVETRRGDQKLNEVQGMLSCQAGVEYCEG